MLGVTLSSVVLLVIACGTPGQANEEHVEEDVPERQEIEGPSAEAPPVQAELEAVNGQLPEDHSASDVASGKGLFEGRGNCASCHGFGGSGSAVAPSLADQDWIHISGTFGEILDVVTKGIPQPTQFSVPMPARGAGTLNDGELRAVSGYVWSLSHSN